MVPKGVHAVHLVSEGCSSLLSKLLDRTSNTKKLLRIVAYVLKWRPSSKIAQVPNTDVRLPLELLTRSKVVWLKFAQKSLVQELESSTDGSSKSKVTGRFRKLSPFEDDGLWRVGFRLREYTPFTNDHKPPVLLPYEHRFTRLLMQEAHEKKDMVA